jgi:hypothetical protein
MLLRFKTFACFVLFLAFCHPIATAKADDTRGLVLRGKILKIRTDRTHDGYVTLVLDLSLEFFNAGSAPVIVMRPWDAEGFHHGASSLATTLENAQSHRYFFGGGGWLSTSIDDFHRRLADDLDQATPPERLTRTLTPGTSWHWQTSVRIAFEENNPRAYSVTWEEMKTHSSPLWLRLHFEMWPFNVEHFKPNLASKLQKRWRKFGYLWIGEKTSESVHLARLASEPIELDWNAALIQ